VGSNVTDGTVGRELYVHDPATGSTTLVADLVTGSGSSSPQQLTVFDGKLYLTASGNNVTDGAVSQELYVHDPATGSTALVADLRTDLALSNFMTGFTIVDGKLYFRQPCSICPGSRFTCLSAICPTPGWAVARR